MTIQCQCGKFAAELMVFPKNSPGRLACYCDDCQAYMHYLKRPELLDSNGATEIVPVYPKDVRFLRGEENLKCIQASENEIFRFFVTCCMTPIANVHPNTPWIGLHACLFDGQNLEPVRSRIHGQFAKGTPPAGTPKSFNLKAMATVLPFILKGKILGKTRPSPFFENGSLIPKVGSRVLTIDELQTARNSAKV